MNKPFSSELYKHDGQARLAVFDIFRESRSLTVEDIPDKYGVDLALLRGVNRIGGLELEVKNNWVGDFPFPDVQFLSRKSHYRETLWVLFNRDCTGHLTVKMKDIVTCPKRIVSNKYLQGEEFYIIPLSLVRFDGLRHLIRVVDNYPL